MLGRGLKGTWSGARTLDLDSQCCDCMGRHFVTQHFVDTGRTRPRCRASDLLGGPGGGRDTELDPRHLHFLGTGGTTRPRCLYLGELGIDGMTISRRVWDFCMGEYVKLTILVCAGVELIQRPCRQLRELVDPWFRENIIKEPVCMHWRKLCRPLGGIEASPYGL